MNALALMLAAAPLWAQTPPDPIQQGAQKLAQARAAAGPVAVAPKPVRALMDRLIATGELNVRPSDVFHYLERGDAPGPGMKRTITMGIVEVPPPKDAGRLGGPDSPYRDALERHVYTHLEIQVVTTAAGTGGAGTLESRIYKVSLDAQLFGVILQQAPGVFNAKGELEVNSAAIKTSAPTPAAAKPDWDKLVPELLNIHRLIEA
jgi:hypothetical protein